CPYCNFYSVKAEESLMDAYTEQICRALAASAERWQRRADTLYFGGGTPILLGARRIERIVSTARRHFGLQNAEITLEANPASTLEETLRDLFAAGVNRLSFGTQSADEEELRILGRRHTAKEAAFIGLCAGGGIFQHLAGFDAGYSTTNGAIGGKVHRILRRNRYHAHLGVPAQNRRRHPL
ncbi:MAG: radical SAM protein, partial [Christensenellales bacterium]